MAAPIELLQSGQWVDVSPTVDSTFQKRTLASPSGKNGVVILVHNPTGEPNFDFLAKAWGATAYVGGEVVSGESWQQLICPVNGLGEYGVYGSSLAKMYEVGYVYDNGVVMLTEPETISFTADGTWKDVDLSALTNFTSGKAVILSFETALDSVSMGSRHGDSQTDWTAAASDVQRSMMQITGTDAATETTIKLLSEAGGVVKLVGYFTAGITTIADASQETLTEDVWNTLTVPFNNKAALIDVSLTPGTSKTGLWARMMGDTPAGISDTVAFGSLRKGGFVISGDAVNQEYQVYKTTGTSRVRVTGYLSDIAGGGGGGFAPDISDFGATPKGNGSVTHDIGSRIDPGIGGYLVGASALTSNITPTFDQPVVTGGNGALKFNPGHYLKAYTDPVISAWDFIRTEPLVLGVLTEVRWKDFEISKDVYDFTVIESYMNALKPYGKRLILELRERDFDSNNPRVSIPQYILDDPIYKGGYEPTWHKDGTQRGFIAKIWIPAVADRMIKAMKKIIERYDPEDYFEGLNTAESSAGFGGVIPADYTPEAYVAQVIRINQELIAVSNRTAILAGTNYVNGGGTSGPLPGELCQAIYDAGGGFKEPDNTFEAVGRTSTQQYVDANLAGNCFRVVVGSTPAWNKTSEQLPGYSVQNPAPDSVVAAYMWSKQLEHQYTHVAWNKYQIDRGMLDQINANEGAIWDACPVNMDCAGSGGAITGSGLMDVAVAAPSGVASYTYTWRRDTGEEDSGVVTFTITNVQPQAVDKAITVASGASVDMFPYDGGWAFDQDDQVLDMSITANPTEGTLVTISVDGADDTWRYTAPVIAGATQAIDGAQFTVLDNDGGSDIGTIRFNVQNLVAIDRTVVLQQSAAAQVLDMSGFITDPGGTATIQAVSAPSGGGSLQITGAKQLTYTPLSGIAYIETASFVVSNGTLSDTGLITFRVGTPGGDPDDPGGGGEPPAQSDATVGAALPDSSTTQFTCVVNLAAVFEVFENAGLFAITQQNPTGSAVISDGKLVYSAVDANNAAFTLQYTPTNGTAVSLTLSLRPEVTPASREMKQRVGKKDEEDIADFLYDWTTDLGASDTISDIDMLYIDGITILSHTFTSSKAGVWCKGGANGVTGVFTMLATTASGRTYNRSFRILVEDL